jgi:hypothetical protein
VWTCSSNLQLQGGNTGTSKVFKAVSGSYSSSGWVRVTINGSLVVEKNGITVNFPDQLSNELINVGIGQPYTVTIPSSAYPDATSYTWSWAFSYSGGVSLQPGSNYAIVSFSSQNVYTLFAHAVNACGTSSSPTFIYNFNVVNYTTYSAYPNPVSSILNIEFEQEKDIQSLGASGTIVSSSGMKGTEPVHEVRLYDWQGQLQRQATTRSGKAELNVSGLPDGIYYLHVYSEESDKPDTRKIVVKH